jgi:hypothetical protein
MTETNEVVIPWRGMTAPSVLRQTVLASPDNPAPDVGRPALCVSQRWRESPPALANSRTPASPAPETRRCAGTTFLSWPER